MILSTAPESIELVNQSECRFIRDIAYEFPQPGEPFGPSNLFIDATDEDGTLAKQLGYEAHLLYRSMDQVRRQDGLLDDHGWRRAGTLDDFENCTVGGRVFEVLGETALLAAVQDLPESVAMMGGQASEFELNMLRHVIDSARLLGAVLLHENMLPQGDASSLSSRFVERFKSPDLAYLNSASEGARSLLQAVRIENLDAQRGGPMEDLDEPDFTFSPESAIKSYHIQNPYIVYLANRQPGEPLASAGR